MNQTRSRESVQAQLRAADDYRRHGGYHLDTSSHINPQGNLTILRGTYMALKQMGASKECIIEALHHSKERIRRRDAEPAAWFTRPTRTEWVSARHKRGEFKTDAELGRALMGDEQKAPVREVS